MSQISSCVNKTCQNNLSIVMTSMVSIWDAISVSKPDIHQQNNYFSKVKPELEKPGNLVKITSNLSINYFGLYSDASGFLTKFTNSTYFAYRACRHAPERVHNVYSTQGNSEVCDIKNSVFGIHVTLKWENRRANTKRNN